MEFLSQHVIPPTEHYLDLLQFLSVLIYTIHFSYIGMVIGGVGAAMWFTLADSDNPNPRYARFAGDILNIFPGSAVAILVLGILPILVITLVHIQWFVGAQAKPLEFVPWTLVPVILGFLALGLYRRSFATRNNNIKAHLATGTLGIGLLLVGYFIMTAIFVRLQDPEKWFRATDLADMLLNWSAIWKFLFFLHASFVVFGCAVLFFFFKWSKTRIDPDGDYAGLVRNFGAGLAFAFSMALPVFYVLYIFTTPDVALDNVVYLLATTVIFLVLVNAILLFSNLRASRTRFASAVFVMFLVVFAVLSFVDQRTMVNANMEHRELLVTEADKILAEREAELLAAAESGSMEGRGEEIFTTQCMACHRFDSQLVGPPLFEVLPKYADNFEGLKAFIKSPRKINPDLPPMPALGLSDRDIEAVAGYVTGQLKKQQAE
jgi:cytochrome c